MDFKELNKGTKEYMKQMKGLDEDKLKGFLQFKNQIEQEGALDAKTKKLILLGMAIKAECSYCIGLHVQGALSDGATKDEIIETIWLAALMGGGPSLMYGQEALKALEDFE